jgi:hypothetical protein
MSKVESKKPKIVKQSGIFLTTEGKNSESTASCWKKLQ